MAPTNPGSLQAPGSSGLTPHRLLLQNRRFDATGGVSVRSRPLGFRPAFLDVGTGAVYLSRFADGRPAPMHLLDGLPAGLVTRRTATGQVAALLASVTAGFVREGRFYTRREAADFAVRTGAA